MPVAAIGADLVLALASLGEVLDPGVVEALPMTPPVAVLTPVNTAATRTRPSGVVDAVLAGHSHRGRSIRIHDFDDGTRTSSI